MSLGCEVTNYFGLTAVRMNGVVSVYEYGEDEPVKQYIDNNTSLEVLIYKLIKSAPYFVGNIK